MANSNNRLTGHGVGRPLQIDFQTTPERYQHWQLKVEPPIAILSMDVDERKGVKQDYELKLNSYDLGVDIELYDAVQRIRFEYPEVGAVLITSMKEKIFCAGANIGMLKGATHGEKVNFCKFTNETRCAIEQASSESGQKYIAVINGTASGGGYELALACDYIMLVDDGTSSVSLPEVPLLGVLPGTGGLTRLVDKRRVRRDRADLFCTTSEGLRGKRALEWSLVDELVSASTLNETALKRALAINNLRAEIAKSPGIRLPPLERTIARAKLEYPFLKVDIDSDTSCANFTIFGPSESCPNSAEDIRALGTKFWPLALARALDDVILHLRTNRPEINNWVFRANGLGPLICEYDETSISLGHYWFLREVRLYWTRILKRLEVTSRSLIALINDGDAFSGTLFELALACDRIYMLDEKTTASIFLTEMNFGKLPMANGLSRLQTRFLDDEQRILDLYRILGERLSTSSARELGLTTETPDEIDWEEAIRLALEERSSFSGDALIGLEANLRFTGPETLETKIFGRLSAWQNWIFERPNANGPDGALQTYGTGQRAEFDKIRV